MVDYEAYSDAWCTECGHGNAAHEVATFENGKLIEHDKHKCWECGSKCDGDYSDEKP